MVREVNLAELMLLDSWLSICGRQPEIIDGKSSMLRNMPNVIQSIFDDLEEDYELVDRSANDGGLQKIRDVAAKLLEILADERLSPAEQIYTLVAMLRTAKPPPVGSSNNKYIKKPFLGFKLRSVLNRLLDQNRMIVSLVRFVSRIGRSVVHPTPSQPTNYDGRCRLFELDILTGVGESGICEST
ncbi:MAG: hypothetical protein Q9213_007795 [Squamulea squamosa]